FTSDQSITMFRIFCAIFLCLRCLSCLPMPVIHLHGTAVRSGAEAPDRNSELLADDSEEHRLRDALVEVHLHPAHVPAVEGGGVQPVAAVVPAGRAQARGGAITHS